MHRQPDALPDAERLDRLRLARTENVGPVTFRQLIGRFGSAAAALEALPQLAQRGGRRSAIRIASAAAGARELEALRRAGGRLLVLGEPAYPAALAAIDDAPPVVSVAGDARLLARKAVAIVGARNASANGRKIAETLARDLAGAGFAVVSGLARGIDAAAHRGALEGGTVAVVAGGLDIVYPPEHEALQRSIAERGAVLAEMPPGTVPQARHFPRRNRLISGLALGVLVVEAAERSGSLITARFALEQGREVMAVPGSPLDPRCRGTNHLIRQGAALVETASDVIGALEGMTGPSQRQEAGAESDEASPHADPGESELSEARRALELLLSPSPVGMDELVRQCRLPAPVVSSVLLELELAGRLERHPGSRVSLFG